MGSLHECEVRAWLWECFICCSHVWSGSSSINAGHISGFSCCRILCEHTTKPSCLSSHFIFYLCHFMLQNLLSPAGHQGWSHPQQQTPKPALYWISAFSPYVLMEKEKLSFLIPWQLFRQRDHIILTQFWSPQLPDSSFFQATLPSQPWIGLFCLREKNPFLLYSHQKTT